ncbi:MAG: hypothetical protein H5T73_10155 [Actinobacteria bacterium]|nr:hypothetical protein [Actinomycetota bacterium]
MRRSLAAACALLILALLPCLAASQAWAEGGGREVDSRTLLQDWESYDGEEVVFRGEAVGDVMRRGEFAWVMVNDDHYSLRALHEAGELRGGNSGLGVWMPAEEAEKIGGLGRHGSLGDFIEVRGVFHADCGEHGGEFDIHALSVRVIEPGREVDVSPDGWKYLGLPLAFLFALATMGPLFLRRLEDRRSARALLRRDVD